MGWTGCIGSVGKPNDTGWVLCDAATAGFAGMLLVAPPAIWAGPVGLEDSASWSGAKGVLIA